MIVGIPNGVRHRGIPDLLARNHERFLRFVRGKVGADAVAEDIVHGAYVKAAERAAELKSEESAVAWFYRILATTTVDHLRLASRERKAVAALMRETDVAISDEPPRRICGCVKDALPTLKPEYADAISAVDVEGTRVDQHASAVGITPNNASVRLHRARAALRKRVVAVCGACADEGCLDCSCS
jgi:RNA polymerase sigma-70 factor (ECF subfamily)